ncbi:acidic leucine-rich nuclear phosphoprotein 32 mapmodulin isoform 1-T2 [Glossina fuscipes fuscipes]
MEKRIELERRARKANQITDLNLDNCRSTSIVGLTDEYTALESLSLINVGLTTLKGFPKLPNLKKLELSDNRISNGLNYLHTSPKLQYINLSGNKIKDLEALKPLKEFKQLTVLDLFNNEATQSDNYREKIFEMLPSLKFLDGFDIHDVEATSEGDDDEENGNYSEDDDKLTAFCLNGLEIDLDELEAFEKQLQVKRASTNSSSGVPATSTQKQPEVDDDLDEYLKKLKLKEEQIAEQPTTVSSSNTVNTSVESARPMNVAFLMYWFLAILNLANAVFYSESGDTGDDDEHSDDDFSDDEDNGDVSLAEVYNDDLEEDEDEWDEENAEDDDDDDYSDDDEANESSAAAGAVAAATANKAENKKDEANNASADEPQARGKKRKHDG